MLGGAHVLSVPREGYISDAIRLCSCTGQEHSTLHFANFIGKLMWYPPVACKVVNTEDHEIRTQIVALYILLFFCENWGSYWKKQKNKTCQLVH